MKLVISIILFLFSLSLFSQVDSIEYNSGLVKYVSGVTIDQTLNEIKNTNFSSILILTTTEFKIFHCITKAQNGLFIEFDIVYYIESKSTYLYNLIYDGVTYITPITKIPAIFSQKKDETFIASFFIERGIDFYFTVEIN